MTKARGITEVEITKRMDAVEQQTASDEAQVYLRETDWYVLRNVETGAPIPKAIREKRQAARECVTQSGSGCERNEVK